eukprot:357362-Chlamydomonas_euryale.AAC.2
MAAAQGLHLPVGSSGDGGSVPSGSDPLGPHPPSTAAAALVGVWLLVDAVYRYEATDAGAACQGAACQQYCIRFARRTAAALQARVGSARDVATDARGCTAVSVLASSPRL